MSLGFFLNEAQILGASVSQIWFTLGPTNVLFIEGFRPIIAMCSAKSNCALDLTVHSIDVPFQSILCPVSRECFAGADVSAPKRSSALSRRSALSCSVTLSIIAL